MLYTQEEMLEDLRKEREAHQNKLDALPNRYRFISTPGHGYLKADIKQLEELGIADKITAFSYVSLNGKTIYLEEDCDMGVFLDALGKQKGVERNENGLWTEEILGIKITYTHEEYGDSRIERLARYHYEPPTTTPTGE